MEIHIWSDVACPFCYIGREHLINALKLSGLKDIHLSWHSFQLDPSISKEDEDESILTHLSVKKGMSLIQVEQMMGNVESMGRDAGLTLNLSSTPVYNTLPCHLILQYAKSRGLGDAMKHTLLERHFVRNQNLSEVSNLNQALQEIGIIDMDASSILSDEQWMSKVEDDLYTAQQFNIRGVPFFVFDNKYALSGAQPVDVFVRVLKQTLEDSK
jgi:predicted DsbA family dithiol-disulfide isomerase